MLVRRIKSGYLGALLLVAFFMAPAASHAFSLWPFSSEPAPAKPVVTRVGVKQPSTWDKVTTGTKNVFNKTGEKLGLKKPQKKPMPQFAYATPPTMQRAAPAKKSWFSSMFGPKEPTKPKTVGEWMETSKRIDP
jgi:hypothetical protein